MRTVECPSCHEDRYAESHGARQPIVVCQLCGGTGQAREEAARQWSELRGKQQGAWAAMLAAQSQHDGYLGEMTDLVRREVARRDREREVREAKAA